VAVIRPVVPWYVRPRAKGTSARRVVLPLLVMAIVLSPNVTIRSGLYKPRGEDFILAVVAAVWVLGLPLKRRSMEPRADYAHGNLILTRIVAGMFYLAAISIGVGAIAYQQQVIFNDLMILPMIVRYWLVFQVGQWVVEETEQQVFLWALVVSLGISASIGILQHFNLLGINDWLTPLYVLDHMQIVGLQMVKLGLPGARVVGTHGDPRHYAYILVIGIGLCIAILLNLRRTAMQVMAILVLGLCLVATAFAASRTAVLSSVVVFLAAIVIQQRGFRGGVRLIGLLLVLVPVIALVSPAFESSTFQDRILDLDSTSFDTSLQARIRDFTMPFEQALESPILWVTGRGPSKAELRTDSHNDFGWYFNRFGLPGLLLYLSLIVYGLKLSLRAWRNLDDPARRTISMAASFSIVNWFLFAMAENIFKDPQLMALNMLLIGACVGVTRREQND
jgi:O-antigen ligase